MAVGLGYLFGIRLPQNFNSPYKALDISDFWRRWHISLSTCLRDYLYIPLGGNRGPAWQTYRNLMITMLLGGLWHGANWTFVFWGGYHGLLLGPPSHLGCAMGCLPRAVRNTATMLLVIIGWVFFRSETFGMAVDLLRKMFVPHGSDAGLPTLPWAWCLGTLLLVVALVAHLLPNSFELKHDWGPIASVGLARCSALAARDLRQQRSPIPLLPVLGPPGEARGTGMRPTRVGRLSTLIPGSSSVRSYATACSISSASISWHSGAMRRRPRPSPSVTGAANATGVTGTTAATATSPRSQTCPNIASSGLTLHDR